MTRTKKKVTYHSVVISGRLGGRVAVGVGASITDGIAPVRVSVRVGAALQGGKRGSLRGLTEEGTRPVEGKEEDGSAGDLHGW